MPHSEISGSPGARPSPELFAACHVLHRLSVPRHPPDALTSRSPTPSPKRAEGALGSRGQRSEVRPGWSASARCLLLSEACVGSPLPGPPAPAYLHTHARARPIDRPKPAGPVGRSCHARFTVTTRFTMSKRPHGTTPPPRGQGAPISCPGSRKGRPCLATHAWWAWADLNGRPHAYQACALAS